MELLNPVLPFYFITTVTIIIIIHYPLVCSLIIFHFHFHPDLLFYFYFIFSYLIISRTSGGAGGSWWCGPGGDYQVGLLFPDFSFTDTLILVLGTST